MYTTPFTKVNPWRWLLRIGSKLTTLLTLPSPLPAMLALIRTGLPDRSFPVTIFSACRYCTKCVPSVLRATKYIVCVLESITGVPTMPILLAKSVYGEHQPEVISPELGGLMPGTVKFLSQYRLPVFP